MIPYRLLRRLGRRVPPLKRGLIAADERLGQLRHAVGTRVPSIIRARPMKLTVAITAECNQRCVGCRYGRDFMPGQSLPLETFRALVDDAVEARIPTMRIYGGEPLLHPELPTMVEYSVDRGLGVYLTTNGVLLGRKIEDLYAAGLRSITVGFYGTDDTYDRYVGRPGQFQRLIDSLSAVRDRFGDQVGLQLNYLVMRPSSDLESLHRAWEFAQRFGMKFHTDLIHYSLPYFLQGQDNDLQFGPEDRPAIEALVEEMVRLQAAHPDQFAESAMSLRSIPDWLLRGSQMRVPCDAYKLIWVGADGTVQLCYVTFKLGNLHETRLRDLLYTADHHGAAREAFALNCPNCHCERAHRIARHGPSRKAYGC